MHNAELQVRKLLTNVREKISSMHLQRLIEDHCERSRLHHESVQIILDEMGEPVFVEENESITAFIKELDSVLHKCKEAEVIDAAVIGSLQNVIHYLISGYGTCGAYADSLSMPEIGKLLNNILKEQKLQDERLSRLAKENINEKAKFPMML